MDINYHISKIFKGTRVSLLLYSDSTLYTLRSDKIMYLIII